MKLVLTQMSNIDGNKVNINLRRNIIHDAWHLAGEKYFVSLHAIKSCFIVCCQSPDHTDTDQKKDYVTESIQKFHADDDFCTVLKLAYVHSQEINNRHCNH